jgi:hypothetical protein
MLDRKFDSTHSLKIIAVGDSASEKTYFRLPFVEFLTMVVQTEYHRIQLRFGDLLARKSSAPSPMAVTVAARAPPSYSMLHLATLSSIGR